MIERNKCLLVFPDGVGIRNYLYSEVVKHLKTESDIVIWSTLSEEAFEEVKTVHNIDFEYSRLVLKAEGIFTRVFRESATFGRLISNSKRTNNKTILSNWQYQPKGLKLKMLNKASMIIGSWATKKYSRILNLEDKAKNHWKRSIINEYKRGLKQLNPTSIFITHQRVATLMPICIAAKELNIPVITAIYSWDNLPKARLAVQADKYIVWSDFMKKEMETYYPEINENDVIVTGTPQFEFYNKQDMVISREDFAAQYGLDINKNWICFSGDDKTTSPNDPFYLKDVMEAVLSTSSLNNTQVVFRRSPADFSDRYDKVLSSYKNLISIDPLWHTAAFGWTSFFPKYADVALLVNIVYHCKTVINVGSTMAHDFAVFNKPCLYINYDKKVNKDWSSKVVYSFQHFQTMRNLDAVGWLNSSEEIPEKLVLSLNAPELVGKDRKKWLEKIALHPLGLNSNKIAEVILNVSLG